MSNKQTSEVNIFSSIGSKIVLPYLLLTIIIAGIGAFIFVNFFTTSLQERFNNQLVNAGRVTAERMVAHEQDRLAVLRQIAFTEGIPAALANNDYQTLSELVPPIVANSTMNFALLLDLQGSQIFGWQQSPNEEGVETYVNANVSSLEDVQLVLEGYADENGDKRAFFAQMNDEPMLITVGPVYNGNDLVGAILIGNSLNEIIVDLTETAVARVTLYDKQGNVIATTINDGSSNMAELLQEPPEQYNNVVTALRESPDQYVVVFNTAEDNVPLRQIEILNQNYELAFGDWRLRDSSYGLFSVALPTSYIFSTVNNSRNVLNVIFIVATIAVILVGFVIARRIVSPLNRLVDVTTAVTEGDLEQRTGIERKDEIGALAFSFDTMTTRLDSRTQELIEQKSGLSAILYSIADGVIVLDNEYNIVNLNPAAEKLLSDMASGFSAGALHEIFNFDNEEGILIDADGARRFELQDRVLSATTAPVLTPDGIRKGTVMVLRDITREAEAESLKDDFITSMSHELRTPLTVIKVYADLLTKLNAKAGNDQQTTYLTKIQKASNELEDHIQKMISISEIQAGTLNIKPEELTISDLVGDVANGWRNKIEAKGIQFDIDVPFVDIPVMADPTRLSWALSNLLENACTYTDEGKITLSLTQKENAVSIVVTDTGIGIPSADMPYIFERFFRAKNDINFSARGIGLGLFITKEIIELHDGQIQAESKLGVGSKFTIELPLQTKAVAEPVVS